MATNKERREQEEKWQAGKDLKKSKEVETVVLSLFAAFRGCPVFCVNVG